MAGGYVAKLVSVAKASLTSGPYEYREGVFYPVEPTYAGMLHNARVIVLRGGVKTQAAIGTIGTRLRIGDVIRTSPGGVCALAFDIGGRVAINPKSAVMVVGERTVEPLEPSWNHVPMQVLQLWLNDQGRTHPLRGDGLLEIQTSGGVIGIKG